MFPAANESGIFIWDKVCGFIWGLSAPSARLLLCFRLALRFHCRIFSSSPSPRFPSADPSLVFSSDCQACCDSSVCHFQHLFLFSPLPRLHLDLCASPPPHFSLSPSVFPVCLSHFPPQSPCSLSHPSSIQSSFLSFPPPSSLPLIWPFVTFFMWLSVLVFTSSVHLSVHLFSPL